MEKELDTRILNTANERHEEVRKYVEQYQNNIKKEQIKVSKQSQKKKQISRKKSIIAGLAMLGFASFVFRYENTKDNIFERVEASGVLENTNKYIFTKGYDTGFSVEDENHNKVSVESFIDEILNKSLSKGFTKAELAIAVAEKYPGIYMPNISDMDKVIYIIDEMLGKHEEPSVVVAHQEGGRTR